jgi:uncharacterized protein (DUF849 family)
MTLKACLNGARTRQDHPRCPVTPVELAADAAAVVAAGAEALHVHPRDADGRESIAPADVAAALDAIRAVTDVPVGVTTGAWLVPDLDTLHTAIRRWTVLPDFASVNIHETDAITTAELLLDRGVGVEAGVWSATAGTILVRSGLADRCLRILVEPMEQTEESALANVGEIEAALAGVAPEVPTLLHGMDRVAWTLVPVAIQRDYDIRVGFEDCLTLPDGEPAPDNAAMVRAARSLLDQAGAPLHGSASVRS